MLILLLSVGWSIQQETESVTTITDENVEVTATTETGDDQDSIEERGFGQSLMEFILPQLRQKLKGSGRPQSSSSPPQKYGQYNYQPGYANPGMMFNKFNQPGFNLPGVLNGFINKPNLLNNLAGLIGNKPNMLNNLASLIGNKPNKLNNLAGLINNKPNLLNNLSGLVNNKLNLLNSLPGLMNALPGMMNNAPGLINNLPGLVNILPSLLNLLSGPGLFNNELLSSINLNNNRRPNKKRPHGSQPAINLEVVIPPMPAQGAYYSSPAPAPYYSPAPAPYYSPAPAPYYPPAPAPYYPPTPAPYYSPTPAPYNSPTPAPYYSSTPAPYYSSPAPAYDSPAPYYSTPAYDSYPTYRKDTYSPSAAQSYAATVSSYNTPAEEGDFYPSGYDSHKPVHQSPQQRLNLGNQVAISFIVFI